MRTANSTQRKFPTAAALLAVIILASMLIAFAASQHGPSPTASAQDASSNADLASLSIALNERLTPRFDPAVTSYTVRVTRTNVSVGNIYISAAAKERGATITVTSGGQEIRGGGNYRVPVSDFETAQAVQIKVTATDGVTTKVYTLTTEPLSPTPTHTPTATATHTPSPTATSTATSTPTPTVTPDPSLQLVETQCGPATDLGASASSDRDRYEPQIAIKYPKLGRDAGSLPSFWNEVVQKYTSALSKGLSAEQAFEATNDRISWFDDFHVKEPDSTSPHYRVLGYLILRKPSKLDHSGAFQLLKSFLVSQGETASPNVVFGEYQFLPEDSFWNPSPEIIDLYSPINLAGPLSELQEVKRLEFIEIPDVIPEASRSTTAHAYGDEKHANNSNVANTKTALWHGADAWHIAGYNGKGIRIGVIDGDFDGFSVY